MIFFYGLLDSLLYPLVLFSLNNDRSYSTHLQPPNLPVCAYVPVQLPPQWNTCWDASVANKLSWRADSASEPNIGEMEFQNISNSVFISNSVSMKEKMNYNENVSEITLLGAFFIALSMR